MSVRYISAHELARILGKDPRTIARWCACGDVRSIPMGSGAGRRYLILVHDDCVTIVGESVNIKSADKAA